MYKIITARYSEGINNVYNMGYIGEYSQIDNGNSVYDVICKYYNKNVILINGGGLSTRLPKYSKIGKFMVPINNITLADYLFQNCELLYSGILILPSDTILEIHDYDNVPTVFTNYGDYKDSTEHGIIYNGKYIRNNNAELDYYHIDTGAMFIPWKYIDKIFNKFDYSKPVSLYADILAQNFDMFKEVYYSVPYRHLGTEEEYNEYISNP